MDDVWREDDTTPGAIEAALRKMCAQRHKQERAYVPARVMNMVVIVDRDFRGEIENRLQRVGRFHPSRLILVAVEPGRRQPAAGARPRRGGASGPRGCSASATCRSSTRSSTRWSSATWRR